MPDRTSRRCTRRSGSWPWRMNGTDVPIWMSAAVDVRMAVPFTSRRGGQMNGLTGVVAVLGIDLAKHVFALHGVDAAGRVVLKQIVSRSSLNRLIAQLPTCLIGL